MEERNHWITAGRLWMGVAFVFLYLPMAVLILFSFQQNRFPGLPLRGFTWAWYEKMLDDGVLITALQNSMLVSPAAATVATIIGFFAAYAMNRFVFRGQTLTMAVIVLPILIPTLILGVAFLGLLSRLNLSGTLFSIFLAHVLLVTAPAMAVIQLRLSQMPKSIEEAAWDLGASELQALYKVVLPWAWPGIFGGWLLAFTFSFDEFVIAWFVSGFDQTLPVAIYSILVATIDPSLNAIGTIVFLISGLILVAIELVLMRVLFRSRPTVS